MGAAPSREVAARPLPRSPFYGQRQQIVLIPLLKDFFPSADCALFQQLYDARCDPAVRYYHYVDEGTGTIPPGEASDDTNTRGEAAEDNYEETECDGLHTALTAATGGVRVACSPANIFAAVPCTREELYRLYITEGGERLVYESDEAMLRAYEADVTKIRPLPCAVAFFYDPPEGSEALGAAATATTDLSGDVFPDGCVNVLGCFVKITGFVGDVSRLFRAHTEPKSGNTMATHTPAGAAAAAGPSLDLADSYEVDLYVTKSAGDHNRTHVLLSAIYTYAEQWQRACLSYAAQRDSEDVAAATAVRGDGEKTAGAVVAEKKHTDAEATVKEGVAAALSAGPVAAHGANLPSDLLDSTRLFAASASAYYKHFMQSVAPPKRLQGLFHQPGPTSPGQQGDDSTAAGAAACAMQVLGRVSPPLAAVRMRGRRTNVPLLCFLREVRTILLGMHAAVVKEHGVANANCGASASASAPVDARAAKNGAPARAMRTGALVDVSMWLEDVVGRTPSGATRHGSAADSDPCANSGERGPNGCVDTLLNVHAAAPVVQRLVGHVMDCLLHNLNPQGMVRAIEQQQQQQHKTSADKSESASATGAATEGASGAEQNNPPPQPAAPVPKSLDLRLPGEETIVESWPPAHNGVTTTTTTTTTVADEAVDLSVLKSFLPDKHLYWIVGPTYAERLSATRALQQWHAAGNTVLISHDVADTQGEPPQLAGPTAKDLARVMASLCRPVEATAKTAANASEDDAAVTVTPTVLDVGLALELLPTTDPTQRTVQLCRLPLEEALLGELSNACKLAREAGPADTHWVRSEAQWVISEAQRTAEAERLAHLQQQQQPVETSEDRVSEAKSTAAAAAEVAPRPPEAMDIVGDGAACLYRVVLASGAVRTIAVTPFFLKVVKKRSKKKNALKVKSGAHGTAISVFYSAPEPEPAPPIARTSPTTAAGAASKSTSAAAMTPEKPVTLAAEAGAPSEAADGISPEEGKGAGGVSKAKKKKSKKAKKAAADAAVTEGVSDGATTTRDKTATEAVGVPTEKEREGEKRSAKAEEAAMVTTSTDAAEKPQDATATKAEAEGGRGKGHEAAAATEGAPPTYTAAPTSVTTAGGATANAITSTAPPVGTEESRSAAGSHKGSAVAPPAPVDMGDEDYAAARAQTRLQQQQQQQWQQRQSQSSQVAQGQANMGYRPFILPTHRNDRHRGQQQQHPSMASGGMYPYSGAPDPYAAAAFINGAGPYPYPPPPPHHAGSATPTAAAAGATGSYPGHLYLLHCGQPPTPPMIPRCGLHEPTPYPPCPSCPSPSTAPWIPPPPPPHPGAAAAGAGALMDPYAGRCYDGGLGPMPGPYAFATPLYGYAAPGPTLPQPRSYAGARAAHAHARGQRATGGGMPPNNPMGKPSLSSLVPTTDGSSSRLTGSLNGGDAGGGAGGQRYPHTYANPPRQQRTPPGPPGSWGVNPLSSATVEGASAAAITTTTITVHTTAGASTAGAAGASQSAGRGTDVNDTASASGGGLERHVSFGSYDASRGDAAAAASGAAANSTSAMNTDSMPGRQTSGGPPEMASFTSADATAIGPDHQRAGSNLVWNQSSSLLIFNPDGILSPVDTDSVSRFPATSTSKASNMEGSIIASAAEHALHVTVVRRRGHHHHHQRTGSFFSDATTADGTTNASQSGGGGVRQARSSYSSLPSGHQQASAHHLVESAPMPSRQRLNQPQQQQAPRSEQLDRRPSSVLAMQQLQPPHLHEMGLPPMSPTHSSSFREDRPPASVSSLNRYHTTVTGTNGAAAQSVSGPSSQHGSAHHQGQEQGVGIAPSSTRSGETTTSCARQQLKSGKYRWDWRSVSLSYMGED